MVLCRGYCCIKSGNPLSIFWGNPGYAPASTGHITTVTAVSVYTNGHNEKAHTGFHYDSICTNNGQTLQFPDNMMSVGSVTMKPIVTVIKLTTSITSVHAEQILQERI